MTSGAIVQQLVLLPFHPTKPTPIPFHVTHILLTGTFARAFQAPAAMKPRPAGKLTAEQKLDLVREGVELSFDPDWVGDFKNRGRLNWFTKRMTEDRPLRTIGNFIS